MICDAGGVAEGRWTKFNFVSKGVPMSNMGTRDASKTLSSCEPHVMLRPDPHGAKIRVFWDAPRL